MEAMIWIGLIILFVVVEIATVGLTSIWFAGGALISLILCLCGVGLGWQIGVFFVVSLVLGGIYPAVGDEVFKAAPDPDQLRAGDR